MSTQKFANRNVRKITKLGRHSLAVTLPVEFMKKLAWREKQKVVVSLKGRSIMIKDWRQ